MLYIQSKFIISSTYEDLSNWIKDGKHLIYLLNQHYVALMSPNESLIPDCLVCPATDF
jgi:hypothetical protein